MPKVHRTKKMLKKIIYTLAPKKYIIFESVPDFSDNTKAVFDEMIRRSLNKKYTFVWLLSDQRTEYPTLKNVIYAPTGDTKRKWYIATAKCFICCNRFIYTDNPKQKSFFLTHGMYVKRPTDYYSLPEEITYCLSSSEQLKEVQAKALGTELAKMVPLGFPRNDILTKQKHSLRKYFDVDFRKIIVWYPTFRQHSTGMETGSQYAVPIIWDERKAAELNRCAKELGVVIVLKPHFAQDTSKIQGMYLSNLLLIDDTFFSKNHISSYEFIGSCDAMITDYSSVYFDYTLCDKPIGLIWEDYEEYSKNPGFALDMDYYMKGGVKIYNLDDFKSFLTDAANGVDRLAAERREIRDISNYATDGKNSERVVDFIVKEAKL